MWGLGVLWEGLRDASCHPWIFMAARPIFHGMEMAAKAAERTGGY